MKEYIMLFENKEFQIALYDPEINLTSIIKLINILGFNFLLFMVTIYFMQLFRDTGHIPYITQQLRIFFKKWVVKHQ